MLEVKNLSYSVGSSKKRHEILHDLSFTVKTGEFVVITGPNGSGKSTLAKLIMGIEKPSAGKIVFQKTDITDQNITERARLGIAYAFQQPPHFKGLTIHDLLQVSATGHETFIKDPGVDYDKLIKTVGLDSSYLGREINSTLSGGELKRIEIASNIARQAPLTIFDEPEAGIDIWSFDKLIRIFQQIRKQNPDRSLIIISHQKRLIEQADRIILLKDGKISAQGAPAKILPKLQESAA